MNYADRQDMFRRLQNMRGEARSYESPCFSSTAFVTIGAMFALGMALMCQGAGR